MVPATACVRLILAGVPEAHRAMRRCGGMHVLLWLLALGDAPAVQSQALGALLNLSTGNAATRQALVHAGLVQRLMKLVAAENQAREAAVGMQRGLSQHDVTAMALGCLSNLLTRYRPAKEQLLRCEEGAVGLLVQILRQRAPRLHDAAFVLAEVRNALCVLRGLSSGFAEGWEALVDAGALQALLELRHSCSDATILAPPWHETCPRLLDDCLGLLFNLLLPVLPGGRMPSPGRQEARAKREAVVWQHAVGEGEVFEAVLKMLVERQWGDVDVELRLRKTSARVLKALMGLARGSDVHARMLNVLTWAKGFVGVPWSSSKQDGASSELRGAEKEDWPGRDGGTKFLAGSGDAWADEIIETIAARVVDIPGRVQEAGGGGVGGGWKTWSSAELPWDTRSVSLSTLKAAATMTSQRRSQPRPSTACAKSTPPAPRESVGGGAGVRVQGATHAHWTCPLPGGKEARHPGGADGKGAAGLASGGRDGGLKVVISDKGWQRRLLFQGADEVQEAQTQETRERERMAMAAEVDAAKGELARREQEAQQAQAAVEAARAREQEARMRREAWSAAARFRICRSPGAPSFGGCPMASGSASERARERELILRGVGAGAVARGEEISSLVSDVGIPGTVYASPATEAMRRRVLGGGRQATQSTMESSLPYY